MKHTQHEIDLSRPGNGRTFTLQERRWVDRPVEDVFAYTADFSNIEDWDPGVASSARLDEGQLEVGSRFELEVTFGKSTIPMVYEVTELVPNERVVLVGVGDKIHAIDDIRFSRADNLTVIDYRADLTFTNFIRFLGPLMNRPLKEVGRKALDGLARVLGT